MDRASIGFHSRGCGTINVDFVTGTISASTDDDETFMNIVASDVSGGVHFTWKRTSQDMNAGDGCSIPGVHGLCILTDSARPVSCRRLSYGETLTDTSIASMPQSAVTLGEGTSLGATAAVSNFAGVASSLDGPQARGGVQPNVAVPVLTMPTSRATTSQRRLRQRCMTSFSTMHSFGTASASLNRHIPNPLSNSGHRGSTTFTGPALARDLCTRTGADAVVGTSPSLVSCRC